MLVLSVCGNISWTHNIDQRNIFFAARTRVWIWRAGRSATRRKITGTCSSVYQNANRMVTCMILYYLLYITQCSQNEDHFQQQYREQALSAGSRKIGGKEPTAHHKNGCYTWTTLFRSGNFHIFLVINSYIWLQNRLFYLTLVTLFKFYFITLTHYFPGSSGFCLRRWRRPCQCT